MVNKVTDISSNNPSTYDYIKSLKDKGSRFNFVKLTQGNWYLNDKSSLQILNTLKVFNKQVGIYHYLDSGSTIEQQIDYFMYWLAKYGFSKDTWLMLDTEDPKITNLTTKLNQFIHRLNLNGYRKIFVYSMDSWLSSGKIDTHALKNCFIWTASYGAYPKLKKYDVWQYSGLGTQDWEYDYTGKLNAFKKNSDEYVTKGTKFKVINQGGLNGYKDERLKYKHGNRLGYNTIIYGKIIKDGKTPRLKTRIGYFSCKSKYIEKI